MHVLKGKKTKSYAEQADFGSPLARLFKLSKPESNDLSQLQAIHNNDAALAWRLILIERAKKTIDAQYYSWHVDTSGLLLINKLIEAADRGVRVRVLLDDLNTLGKDSHISALNHHNNIEVRLFNPFSIRKPVWLIRTIELLSKLDILNHRMHNKLLIADNIISIIGGRNIGDEYFGLSNKYLFRDLDVLVSGASVQTLSDSLDAFWNDKNTRPVRKLITIHPGKFGLQHLKKLIDRKVISSTQFISRINRMKSNFINNIAHHSNKIQARAKVIYDPPSQKLSNIEHMMESLYNTSESESQSLIIISAYFVPTASMLTALKRLISRGITIRVYTNSLASIDVTAVFSGYEKYRKKLLLMGVEIYEFRSDPDKHSIYTTPETVTKRFGLHAKSIIYDNNSIYIGTFNLDPRSDTLNTEVGILIDSSELAQNTQAIFEQDVSENNYWRVTLDKNSNLIWRCGNESINKQPARHIWQKLLNLMFSLLPIYRHL